MSQIDFEPEIPTTTPQTNETEVTQETIVKSGGEGMILDDELAALTPEVKTAAKTKKATSKDPQEKKTANEDTTSEETESKDVEHQVEEVIRKLKFKRGETEVELEEDAVVPVKIMGKTEMVPLKELYKNYSGKVAYDRKYQDLAKERETFYTEKTQITDRIGEFHRLAVDENQPRIAIEYLAEAMGADPAEVWNNLIEPIKEQWTSGRDLSPEQLETTQAKQEVEYYRRKAELQHQQQERAQTREKLVSNVRSVQAQYGMSPERFKSAYDEIIAEAQKTGFDAEQITPEMVGEYHQILERRSQLTALVAESFPADERTSEIETELGDVWRKNPDLTTDDLKDIAVQAFGEEPKKRTLVDKVKKQTQSAPSNPRQDPISWDEI